MASPDGSDSEELLWSTRATETTTVPRDVNPFDLFKLAGDNDDDDDTHHGSSAATTSTYLPSKTNRFGGAWHVRDKSKLTSLTPLKTKVERKRNNVDVNRESSDGDDDDENDEDLAIAIRESKKTHHAHERAGARKHKNKKRRYQSSPNTSSTPSSDPKLGLARTTMLSTSSSSGDDSDDHSNDTPPQSQLSRRTKKHADTASLSSSSSSTPHIITRTKKNKNTTANTLSSTKTRGAWISGPTVKRKNVIHIADSDEGEQHNPVTLDSSSEEEEEDDESSTEEDDDIHEGNLISSSSSSSSDEDDNEEAVEKLLSQCESASNELRKALRDDAQHDNDKLLDEVTSRNMFSAGQTLQSYQIAGVNWLLVLEEKGLNGILADEMGLGKTVQATAFLRALRRNNGVRGPHLVVAPGSTLENWAREAETWLDDDTVVVVYRGSQAERDEIRSRHRGGRGIDVLITTYTMFEREDMKLDRQFLSSMPIEVAIFDEAHALKSSSSSRYKQLNRIHVNRMRILLTGTPLQNNLGELLSVLSFCLPKVFNKRSQQVRDALFTHDDDEILTRLRGAMAPFCLRREKADVLTQLAPKTEVVELLEMTPSQKLTYEEVLRDVAKSNPSSAGTKKAMTTTSAFAELRKAANHPCLVRRRFGKDNRSLDEIARVLYNEQWFGDKARLEMVKKEIESYSDWDLNAIVSNHRKLKHMALPLQDLTESCKSMKIVQLLPNMLEQGDRVLIFSQWKIILDVIGTLLEQELGLEFYRLDGDTEIVERQKMVDAFNNIDTCPVKVFLLSSRSGGQGINLTSANVVVLHDLDFNPTIDLQAQDRAHRIGQTRPVRVYKFVTLGTVDEAIYRLQEKKLKVNKRVLDRLPNVLLPEVADQVAVMEEQGGKIEKNLMEKLLKEEMQKMHGKTTTTTPSPIIVLEGDDDL